MSRGAETRLARHVEVSIAVEQKEVDWRIMDLAGRDWAPATKELGWFTVGRRRDLAGEAWQIGLELVGGGTSGPLLRASSYLKRYVKSSANGDRLAALDIPLANLSWAAAGMALRLRLEGQYSMRVRVLQADHPRVAAWAEATKDDAIEFIDDCSEPDLVLPRNFTTEPLARTRLVHQKGTWVRCVFTDESLSTLLQGGQEAAASGLERGWAVGARVHLSAEACCVVIEKLVEMPATASAYGFVTHGPDFDRLRRDLDGRLAGFAHVHPEQLVASDPSPAGSGDADGVLKLTPNASGPDAVAAWNVDVVTPLPVVAPICLAGISREDMDVKLAAHAYARGLLGPVTLEVTDD